MKLYSINIINLSKTIHQVLRQTIFPKGPISEFLPNLFFTNSTNPKPHFETLSLTGALSLALWFGQINNYIFFSVHK
jgi:hypothetical protein